MRAFAGLRQLLGSRAGLLTVAVSGTGTLALGMLQELVKSTPRIGGKPWWFALVALVAVVALAVAANSLYARRGLGVILYFRERGGDTTARELMRQDALERHPGCFLIDPLEFSEDGPEATKFAIHTLRARLEEEQQAHGVPDSVSLYLQARHPDAYELGRLMAEFPHLDVVLRHRSPEGGGGFFDLARLGGPLFQPPSAADQALVQGLLAEEPQWHDFTQGSETANEDAQHIALILSLTRHNPNMADSALRAARGGDTGYEMPPGARCAGALVLRAESYLPSRRDHYEALVRFVAHAWHARLREAGSRCGGEAQGLLMVDGPAPLALALGRIFRTNTDLVPFVRRPSVIAKKAVQMRTARRELPPRGSDNGEGTSE